MKKAFELVNRLENPLLETKRALDLAQSYFESLISDLRNDGVNDEKLQTAGYGFDEAMRKLSHASEVFGDVQDGVRAVHWDLVSAKNHVKGK